MHTKRWDYLRQNVMVMVQIWVICDIYFYHDDVIKWRYFPRYWTFVRGIHRSPVNSPHKTRVAELWCFLWSAINGWINNSEAGDLRRHRAHYDVTITSGFMPYFQASCDIGSNEYVYITLPPLVPWEISTKKFRQAIFSLMLYWGSSCEILLPGDCRWTSLIVSQHWFRWWLGSCRP